MRNNKKIANLSGGYGSAVRQYSASGSHTFGLLRERSSVVA